MAMGDTRAALWGNGERRETKRAALSAGRVLICSRLMSRSAKQASALKSAPGSFFSAKASVVLWPALCAAESSI